MSDEISYENFSGNVDLDFIEFEKQVYKVFKQQEQDDRDTFSDLNGNYSGSYEPERAYVTSLLAINDEFNLGIEIDNINRYSGNTFYNRFPGFMHDVKYATTKTLLRNRGSNGISIGTPAIIESGWKDKIYDALNKIEKIVNQEVIDDNKQDAIYRKINALRSEISRSRTTFDAIMMRMIDFSSAAREVGENIKPLVKLAERVEKMITSGIQKSDNQEIEQHDSKMIESKNSSEKPDDDLDDEIPF